MSKGIIFMWSGAIANIPANWSFCDGADGTPDLRDLFIVGAKQDDAGVAKTNVSGALTQTGGSTSHNHTEVPGALLTTGKGNITQVRTSIQRFYALAYIMHNPGV